MPQDSRRSRMRRTPTGKRLMLTERDLAIFQALRQYRYLRSTYLHAFAGGASETRFKERLGDLFHEGYLDRPETQWRFADCRHKPVVYELGRDARRVLESRGELTDQRRVLLGAGVHRQFEHSVMICELLASIELAAMRRADLRFIPLPEIRAKAPATAQCGSVWLSSSRAAKSHTLPDALFGFEYRVNSRSLYRFFALEADRGTMPILRTRPNATSYSTKLEAYEAIIAERSFRPQLGLPNLLVLTVTTSTLRKDAMLQAIANLPGDFSACLFAAVPMLPVPDLDLIRRRWDRCGSGTFVIDTAQQP